jgi:purine-binding chemotaxis protein CheW
MNDGLQLVLFRLEGQRYAVPLSAVVRVLRMVEVTPLPNTSAMVLGVINIQGRVIPVINLRRRLGLRERDVELSDELLVIQISGRTRALWVDEVLSVFESDAPSLIAAAQVTTEPVDVDGVLKLADGLVLFHHPQRLLAGADPGAQAPVGTSQETTP